MTKVMILSQIKITDFPATALKQYMVYLLLPL